MYITIIFLVLCLCSFLELFTKLRKNKSACNNMLFFFLLLFFFMSFLRWERGTDWGSYYSFFRHLNSYKSEDYECGFTILNRIIAQFGDYTMMLFVQACIFYALIYKCLIKFSLAPLFSLMILFVICNYAGIFFVRQTIAMSITIFSLFYIQEKKFVKFLIVILLAAAIHVSALAFVVSYYIFDRYYSFKSLLLTLLFVVLIGIVFVAYIIPILSSKLWFFMKVFGYLESGLESDIGGMSPILLYYRGVASRLFSLLVILYIVKDIRKRNRLCNGLFNIYFIGVCMYLLLGALSQTLARLAIGFEIVQIFLYPYLVCHYWFKNRLILYFIVTAYFFSRIVAPGPYTNLFVPYKSIFNKELNVEIG